MNGSSRAPTGSSRKPSVQSSMRPPARPGAAPRNISSAASSPVPSMLRSNAPTASPSQAAKRRADAADDGRNEANINVVVRCRGRSEREKHENSAVVVSHPSSTEVALSLGPNASMNNKIYTFDRSFGPEADQQRIYDNVVAPYMNEVLDGYNCTIFAYGQTGTGKTYTMTGDMEDTFGTYSDFAGIIPRVLYKLFDRLGKGEGDNSVKCSFIELYNEELRDLLAPDDTQKVKIFDSANGKGGVVVQGMEESYITSAEAGVTLLKDGSYRRQVAATKCNDLSSRSHTVFTITVQVKDIGEDGEIFLRTGKLNLVDLAGSENIGRSGASDKRAREAGMINQSLLTLGRVINALVDKSSHIPYRESKLTRLLQDSLGGRTKTCIIATISPAKMNIEETMSTLDYAARAKNIRNKPQINQLLNKKTVISHFVADIERLKSALFASRAKNGVYLPQAEFNRMNEELELQRVSIEEFKRAEAALQGQITRARDQFAESMKELLDTRRSLEEQRTLLEETKGALRKTETDLSETSAKLEDETILRTAHQRTEGELERIGTDLVSTARSASSDIFGLHAKIARMASLEVVNCTAWTKNSAEVTNFTEQVEVRIESFTQEQQNLSDAIVQRISGFVASERANMEEAYVFLSDRIDKFNTKEHEFCEQTKESKNDMNHVLEEIKVLREDIKSRVGESLKGLNNAAARIADDVVAELMRFGNELRQFHDSYNMDFKNMADKVQQHIKVQHEEVGSVGSQLVDAAAAVAKEMETARRNLRTVLDDERQKASLDRGHLIDQITSLVNETVDKQERRLAERIDGVRVDMMHTQVKLETTSHDYEDGMDSWATRDQDFYSELCHAKDTVRHVLSNDLEKIERHNATIQEATRSIHAQTVKLVDEQTKDVGVQMEALDEFVGRARSQNEHHHVAFVSSLESLTTNAQESFHKLGADIRKFKSGVDSIADISAQAKEGAESVAPFGEYVRGCLSDLRDRVESNPLQEYIPSGQTPRKTRYNFPTVLPSTGSAEDVIARAKGITRPPLGEKEVNSPKKAVSDGASILTSDPKSGGAAGIGAAFYPNAPGKQKTVPRTPDLGAGMKENLAAMGSSDEEAAGTRRRSSRKRKVSDELSNLVAGTITTRRRMR